MKSIISLVLFILCFTTAILSENIKNDKENILDAAELYFAQVFENEFMKLKEGHPLRLSEDILPIDILNKTSLNHYETFTVFQWKMQTFILGATNSETCVFINTFSEDRTFLRKFIKIEHMNFVQHVDYLKILINDDKLWIFEASNHGNVILVIRIKLNVDSSANITQQVIPIGSSVSDIHPFMYKDLAHLCVTSQKPNETTEMFFSEENEIFHKQFKKSFSSESDFSISSFLHKKNSYIVLIGEQKIVIERYDVNKTEEIWSSSIKSKGFFYFKDELSQNLFLVLIRDQSVDLYLFRGEKILTWKKIQTESAVKVGHFFMHTFRNFLVLPTKSKVSIYTQNKNGEFFPKWVFENPCNDLKEVKALFDDRRIVIVSLCAGGQQNVYFHQLQIKKEYVPEFQSDSPHEDLRIEKCLSELENVLKRNEILIPGLLNSVHKGGFLPLDALVTTSYNRRLEDYSIYSPTNKLVAVGSEVDKLSKIVDSLQNKTKTFQDQLPNLLTYEGSQHIYTTVNANKMVANYSVVMSIDLEKLNEITLDDYRTKFMVMDRPQFVDTNFVFDKIITKNINAKSLSTGDLVVLPENLLSTKNSKQMVTGQHKFSSIEIKGDIVSISSESTNEINDINVNDIVTKFSDVFFEGRRVFHKTLESEEHLKVKYINGVDFDAWGRSVVKSTKGSNIHFGTSTRVEGNVRVTGNVKATSLNGIDFENLFKNIAKKSNLVQGFRDKIVFSKGLQVENLESERVNGLDWSHYLRKRDEKVAANFNVDDGVVMSDLKADDINGLNFGKDVLLSGPDQTLNGRITFVNDVEVTSSSGVTMDTGATINAIDPSLHSQVGEFFNSEVVDKKLNLGDILMINGDVRVTTLNNVTFPDFIVGYWRKSENQRIPNTIAIGKAEFRKSFYASTLNGFEVSDYVRTDVPQTLTARNFFVSDVLVHGDIYMENNRTIGKVDISALKDTSFTLNGSQIISGLCEFEKAIEVNDFLIKDGVLKGINVEDNLLARPFRYQNSLMFASPVVAHSLHAKDIHVGKLNGKEALEAIYEQGASISEIRGNLYAERISVDELIFTKNFNGQNFNEWIASVVSKDKPAHVFSEKVTVSGDVFFTGSLDVNFLNAKHLKTLIKQLNRDCDECEIRGKKSFSKPIEVFGDLFAEYINNVSLHELKERLLSKKTEQTIKGVYEFKGGLTSVAIEAPKVSGIPINDIVLANNINLQLPAKFNSDVTFDELHSKDGWIDGCKLEEVFNPPFSDVGNFLSNISFGHLEVTGKMTVNGKIRLRSINDDLRIFIKKLVTKTSEQNIFGSSSFQNEGSVQSLKAKYINKHRSQDFVQKYFERQRDVQTNCNIEVEHLSVNEVISSDVSTELINNMKLKLISDFGVKRNSQEVISGKKTFPNAIINGNLKVQKISDIDIDSLMKLNDEYAEAKLVFMKSISFTKNIWVYGLIAQENANSLFKHFDSTRLTNPLPFPTKYEQLIIEGDLNVKAVNNLRLDDLFLKSSTMPVVTGRKNFIGGIVIEGESDIDVINGFHPNQFREWSYIVSQEKTERFDKYEIREKSMDSDIKELRRLAFARMKLNEANVERSKGLYRKLFSITRADGISLSGDRIHGLRMSLPTVAHVFAEYDACLSRNLCPCFDTYTLKINNSKLELDNESFKGRNFQILLPAENDKLFNFNVRCFPNEVLTFIGQFQSTEEGAVVVTTETKVYNLFQVLPFDINGQNYFLLYTKDKDVAVTLTVINTNFETLWDTSFNAKISKLVMKEVFGNWNLLVVMNQLYVDELSHAVESQLYSWNVNKEQFVFIRNFPMAATGDITTVDNEIFLVLGFNNLIWSESAEEKASNLQVYKSIENLPLKPFSSVPRFGVRSVVFFIVDNELFLAVASQSENLIAVYRMLHQEGFVLEKSFTVINPSELNYVNIQDRHYLLLLHDKSVMLLNLNFKGVSSEIH